MNILLLAFAVLVISVGLVIVARPGVVMVPISRYSGSLVLVLSAIGVRFIVGVALLLSAEQSRFPITLTILGWLFIMAALAIAVMGRPRLKQLIEWGFNFVEPYARIAGFIAICFGGFLAYAVV